MKKRNKLIIWEEWLCVSGEQADYSLNENQLYSSVPPTAYNELTILLPLGALWMERRRSLFKACLNFEAAIQGRATDIVNVQTGGHVRFFGHLCYDGQQMQTQTRRSLTQTWCSGTYSQSLVNLRWSSSVPKSRKAHFVYIYLNSIT